jgi:hypothetical protein
VKNIKQFFVEGVEMNTLNTKTGLWAGTTAVAIALGNPLAILTLLAAGIAQSSIPALFPGESDRFSSASNSHLAQKSIIPHQQSAIL